MVNLHYCMDRFAGAALGDTPSEKCGKCGMPSKEKNDCCHDELQLIKLKQDVTAATYPVVSLVVDPAVLTHFTVVVPAPVFTVATTPYQAHAPPLLSKQDTYLYNGVFRI